MQYSNLILILRSSKIFTSLLPLLKKKLNRYPPIITTPLNEGMTDNPKVHFPFFALVLIIEILVMYY